MLALHQVRVWHLALGRRPDALADLLSPDERERAGRYHFERDRTCFITVRATLRRLLGQHLDLSPQAVKLCYGAHGKLALPTEGRRRDIRFNVSHSGDRALIAMALGREVGVDIERIRPLGDTMMSLAQYFSPAEQAALAVLETADCPAAFFACWTRKEAYVKARGLGMSLDLQSFDVSLQPGQPAALLRTSHDPPAVHRWSMHDLDAGPGYSAALVVEGGCRRVDDAPLEPHQPGPA